MRRPSHPGWVAELVGALSQCTKVVGLIPGQGTYENQPMNAQVGGTTYWFYLLFFFLSLCLTPSSQLANQLKKI